MPRSSVLEQKYSDTETPKSVGGDGASSSHQDFQLRQGIGTIASLRTHRHVISLEQHRTPNNKLIHPSCRLTGFEIDVARGNRVIMNVIRRGQLCHGHPRKSRAQAVDSKLSNLDFQPRHALRTAFALIRCCELPHSIMQGAGVMNSGRDHNLAREHNSWMSRSSVLEQKCSDTETAKSVGGGDVSSTHPEDPGLPAQPRHRYACLMTNTHTRHQPVKEQRAE